MRIPADALRHTASKGNVRRVRSKLIVCFCDQQDVDFQRLPQLIVDDIPDDKLNILPQSPLNGINHIVYPAIFLPQEADLPILLPRLAAAFKGQAVENFCQCRRCFKKCRLPFHHGDITRRQVI